MNNRALSLLEILIASLILAFVITGLLGIFIQGKSLSQHNRARIAAGELGKYFLEPLQMQVREDNWTANCLGINACAGVSETLNGITYNATYNTDAVANTTLRRANVTITWNDTSS